MINNIIITTFYKLTAILDKRQRKKILAILFLIIFSSFSEVLGLAFILPILYVLNEPEVILTNTYLNKFFTLFGFSSKEYFTGFLLLLVPVVFLVKNLISILIISFQNKTIFNIAKEIVNRQFNNVLNENYTFFHKNNSNYILRNIIHVPSEFVNGVIVPFINLFSELFVILFILIGIFIYNFKILLIISTVILPIILLFYYLVKNRIEFFGKEINETSPKTFKGIFDTIYGIEEVKLYKKEKFFQEKSISPLSYLYSLTVKLNILKSIPLKIIETSAVLVIPLLYFLLKKILSNSESIIPLLIVFATASYRLMPSMNRILSAIMDIKKQKYTFDIILNNKVQNNSIKSNNNEKALVFKKKIELKNVNFYYDNKIKIISEINLDILKGEKIGIVGESGSGKSTLLKLLLGLIHPKSGSIKVDNITITSKNLNNWRENIGYVKQDFYLLDASLAENIAFGEELNEINYKKLKKTIKLSALEKVVNILPDGILTKVGEFGNNLSGGQKQRIAIARALYKEAEILIFDEATSALDDETETEVIETINSLSDNLTIIMVAHRKTSLRHCDKIYEIKKGQIFKK